MLNKRRVIDKLLTCASCRFWSKTSMSINEKQLGHCRVDGYTEPITRFDEYCSDYGPRIIGGDNGGGSDE